VQRVALHSTDLYLLSSIRFYDALSSLTNIGLKPAAVQHIVGQMFIAFDVLTSSAAKTGVRDDGPTSADKPRRLPRIAETRQTIGLTM
jgi:hypothetical protein